MSEEQETKVEVPQEFTEELQKEMDVLLEKEEPTEEEKTRVDELEKISDKWEKYQKSLEESENKAETNENKSSDSENEPSENNESDDSPEEENFVYEAEEKTERTYTIETIKPQAEHDQLWGTYVAKNGDHFCRTRCFHASEKGAYKVGDVLELPETTSIRQSHRKLKKGDDPSQSSTFDWLHF